MNNRIGRVLATATATAVALTVGAATAMAESSGAPAPCQAEDVKVSTNSPGSDPQTERGLGVFFEATGSGTCTITGYVSNLRFLDAAGKPLATLPEQSTAEPVTEVVVKPNYVAELSLNWRAGTAGAPDPVTPAEVEFTLPGATGASRVKWLGGVIADNGRVRHTAVFPTRN